MQVLPLDKRTKVHVDVDSQGLETRVRLLVKGEVVAKLIAHEAALLARELEVAAAIARARVRR